MYQGFGHETARHNLVDNVIDLIKVEDHIKFAHFGKSLVERLHENVNQVQHTQLRLGLISHAHKEERGKVAVNDARAGTPAVESRKLDKVASRRRAPTDGLKDL